MKKPKRNKKLYQTSLKQIPSSNKVQNVNKIYLNSQCFPLTIACLATSLCLQPYSADK